MKKAPAKLDNGRPHHGSPLVCDGKLSGTTDTDYFYFFCPRCHDRHIMRVLDYEVRETHSGGERYPEERPKQAKDFTLSFTLYCPNCKLKDFVKISNVGRQGGQIPIEL